MTVTLDEFQSLSAADRHSKDIVEELGRGLSNVSSLVPGFMDVIVVGSYGRGEAAAGVSDFEWITIFDDHHVGREEAMVVQSDLTKYFAQHFGRERLSISKTFGEVAALSALVTNVGGEADTNQTLTYRMLTLAEGRSLTPEPHAKVVRRLADTYGGSHTAGHRLLSLATEVARYWRTLRIDYKYKVDESKKPWALRSIKLRSFWRFWYFSSALHFIAYGPRVPPPGRLSLDPVEQFMGSMGGNPAVRAIGALAKMSLDDESVRNLLKPYDEIHRRCSDLEVRKRLDAVRSEGMESDPEFVQLRDLTRQVHRTMAEIVLQLPERDRREMLEMFLL